MQGLTQSKTVVCGMRVSCGWACNPNCPQGLSRAHNLRVAPHTNARATPTKTLSRNLSGVAAGSIMMGAYDRKYDDSFV